MGFARDEDRRPGRRPAFRPTKKKILIVCEGKKTEPQYFEQFVEAHREAIVDVETAEGAGVPLSVVREAKRLKKEAVDAAKRTGNPYLKYDSVWAAFDVDDHPNVPEALQLAKRNDINVALSNPCFELWLILHLREAPGTIHRHDVQAMLRAFLPAYDKQVDYQKDFRDGYEAARNRARKLDKLAADVKEAKRNPTTNVYMLTESIAPPKRGHPARKKAR